MLVADTLRRLIEDKGITYTFVSAKTNMLLDTISKSLSGKRRLTADELIAICQAANSSLNELQATQKAG